MVYVVCVVESVCVCCIVCGNFRSIFVIEILLMVRLLFVVVGWCGFVDGCLLVCDGEYLGDMILCEFGMLIVGVELVWCSGEICVLMGIVFCVLEC